MCAWCDAHSSWMQEDETVEDINSQASCDVVASHPLLAELSKEIGAKYPELAALVPEISKVAKRWWQRRRSQPRQRRSVRNLCKPFTRPPTKQELSRRGDNAQTQQEA